MASVDHFELAIAGEPIPNARARAGRGHYYTPKTTSEFRERIRSEWMLAGRPSLGGEPFALSAAFFRSTKRPCDLDNLLKAVLDALNGYGWTDDAQLVALEGVRKLEAPTPRTVLRAWVARRVAA
jgi:Holliday junction resolvase RusA-like endonuclease